MGAMPACARKAIVITLGESTGGLGDERGGHDFSDPGQGAKNLDIAVSGRLFISVVRALEFFEQSFDARPAALALGVDQAQTRQQQRNVFGGSLDHPGRDVQRGGLQHRSQLLRPQAANAVFLEQLFKTLGPQPPRDAGDGANSSIAHNQGSSAAGHSLSICA